MFAAAILAGASASAAEIRLENADFEAEVNARGRVPGWMFTQHSGTPAYELKIDDERATKGNRSIRMKRTAEQVYGMIAQRVPGNAYIGQTVEASASIRTEDVGQQGWVLVMSFLDHGDVLWQERTAPLTGTSGWQRVKLRGKVPMRTSDIEVGFLLLDGGTGWADEVTLASLDETNRTDPSAEKGDGNVTASKRGKASDSSKRD